MKGRSKRHAQKPGVKRNEPPQGIQRAFSFDVPRGDKKGTGEPRKRERFLTAEDQRAWRSFEGEVVGANPGVRLETTGKTGT